MQGQKADPAEPVSPTDNKTVPEPDDTLVGIHKYTALKLHSKTRLYRSPRGHDNMFLLTGVVYLMSTCLLSLKTMRAPASDKQ